MSKSPFAIVIMYQGKEPSLEEVTILSKLVNDHLACGTAPTVSVLNANDLSLAAVVKVSPCKPRFSTEEGDHAVSILDMFTGETDRKNKTTLSVNYYRMLVRAMHDSAESSKNFLKALSIINQDMPISEEAMSVHHITPEMLEVAKAVYTDYNV